MRKRLIVEIVAAALVAAALVCVTLWFYRGDGGEPSAPCESPVELRFPDGSLGLLCDREAGELKALLARKGLEACMPVVSSELDSGEYPLSLVLDADCGIAEKRVGTLTGKGSLLAGARLDVNQATAADLVTVPGIGKAISAAIVSERKKNGPFCPLETLTRVKGIGDKKLESFSAYLTARCE